MLGTDAAQIFLMVASVCAVVLTLLVAAALAAVIWAALTVRSLALFLRTETGRIVEDARELLRKARAVRRFVAAFLRHYAE